MESCGWPGNEATVLCITIKVWKGPTNVAVHVHVCDVGVGGQGCVCVCVCGGGGGGGSTSLIAMYVNLNDVAQLVRIT